ncbi:MAG: Gldg family protein [Bacteroidota bacterium]|nr:Gldg family protein [Bacteroidota bacterium]
MIKSNNYIILFLLLLTLLLVNYLLSFTFFRVDLSEDQIHELSPYTKDKLENLDDYLKIDVYLVGDFAVEIEKLEKGLIEKLQEIKVYGGQNLDLSFIDLNEDVELAEDYKKQVFDNGNGIKPAYIDIIKDDKREIVEIWPGISLQMGEYSIPVQLLSPSTRDNPYPINQAVTNYFIDHIEENIVVGLDKLFKTEKKRIHFLQGHGELSVFDQREAWFYLQKNFIVDTLNIKELKTEIYNKAVDLGIMEFDSLLRKKVDSFSINNISVPVLNNKRIISSYLKNKWMNTFKKNPNNLIERLDALNETDLLIVSKPRSTFTIKEKYVIDQYIMNGGKVVWLIDMMDVNEGILAQKNRLAHNEVLDHELQSFLFKYGVRFNKDMVCDVQCCPVVREDNLGVVSKWFFYPMLKNYNNYILMKNVLPIKGRYVCSLDTVGEEKLKRTVVLQTSIENKLMRQSRIQYQNTQNYDPTLTGNQIKNKLNVGYLFEGIFQSNFKNRRIANDFIKNPTIQFKKESIPTKMAFIGDGDLIRNDISAERTPVPLMFEKSNYNTPYYEMPTYGNATFFLNLVDKMLNRDDFIELRSKMNPPRLMKKNEAGKKMKWQLINLALPILLVLIFGFFNLYIRKLKYES